jgi:hypothetical protein
MSNFIINKEDALQGSLNKEHYLQSLLQVLYSNSLLGINDLERIQLQLINTLTETVGYYTKDKSSSVKEETGIQILSSIYYTIGLFLKNQLNIKEAINAIQTEEIKYLFTQGEMILKNKVIECKRLYEIVQGTKLKVENQAYTDTLDYGILLFFEKYDIRFASHETPGAIDYPLAISEQDLVGIEYMEDYLNKVLLENKFCAFFEDKEIEALLRGYSKDSNQTLINIYKLALTNYIGCTLVGKVGKSLDISENDRIYLKSILENLSQVELKNLLDIAEEKICYQLCIEDENIIGYISRTISMIAQEIRIHAEMNTLKNLFITLRWSEKQKFKFEDGKSLKNIAFRQITEEIRGCSEVESKIEIIREELHSLRDLMDVFSADCIFDDEFTDIFKTLSDFEIALLMKHISNETGWGTDYGTESEKEWQEKFKKYFEALNDKKKMEIIRISYDIEI